MITIVFYVYSFFFCFVCWFEFNYQNIDLIDEKVVHYCSNVVKIIIHDSKYPNVDGLEGTGFIIGANEYYYILTAKHNVQPDYLKIDSIEIRFKDNQKFIIPTTYDNIVSQALDVIIIKVQLPASINKDDFQTVRIGKIQDAKVNSKVWAIGHSTKASWDISENKIKNVKYENNPSRFSISEGDLTEGCSGGPIFDEKFNLLGLVINDIKNGFVASNIYNVIRISNEWALNYNHLELSPYSEMVFIPGGKFRSSFLHREDTTIAPFLIDKYEVTNGDYARFLNEIKTDENKNGQKLIYEHKFGLKKINEERWQPQAGYEDHPVIFVTWYGAKEYAKWVNKRLPSEIEWEYAAKALRNLEYATYDGKLRPNSANYILSKRLSTVKVNEYLPNPLGLYNMSGNVWEWCDDNYCYYNSNDGKKILKEFRVLRGGSWRSKSEELKTSSRDRNYPQRGYLNVGFRCVKDF